MSFAELIGDVELSPLQRDFLELMSELRRLSTLVPGDHRLLSVEAKLHEQNHNWEEALAAICMLEELGRPATVVTGKLKGLYNAYRRAHDEDAARRWFDGHGLTRIGS